MHLTNNHLKGFGEINKPTLEKTILAKFSDFQNITINLIENIDYTDRTFINRLDDEETLKKDENFLGLLESIKATGLLNPVYLLEKNKNNYIIISGWRRLLALKEILKENKNKIFAQKAIIFKNHTPLDLLESVSIDENTKRKDLTILELSYKFNKLSSIEGVSLEDCLKKFNIGKTQFHIIKKAIDFNPFIKEFILEEVGPVKADFLNRILEKLLLTHNQNEAQSIVKSYINKSREELKNIFKELEIDSLKKTDIFEFKKNKRMTTFKIKESLSDEDYLKIENFIKTLLKK
ncbi:ParB/RepB/Spo0J family partition protein [Candidatus Cetobacterium colombiensis]|uniref:ParB N-terminal domain-containing protein n=1 Tax=Candidatus Cetobacterium colombiensis TaxID=3073100 RepID=A0ABU4WCG6_9FUSO|nr:ParB N-terminal domain-containing protein [Candidatus Cetobacterium colombiensis]MDX8337226.1 ParB N-terminal domain-containing protein [Candidatus Cetobacterium colombiensis]